MFSSITACSDLGAVITVVCEGSHHKNLFPHMVVQRSGRALPCHCVHMGFSAIQRSDAFSDQRFILDLVNFLNSHHLLEQITCWVFSKLLVQFHVLDAGVWLVVMVLQLLGI